MSQDSYQFFDRMVAGEKNTLTFNMSAGLLSGNLLTGTPTVAVSVYEGTDSNPSGILNGSAALDSTSTLVLVPVAPTSVTATLPIQYVITVTCATVQAAVVLILKGILTVDS